MLCPLCGAEVELVRVHGHAQCPACGNNVEPCCAGAGDEADSGDTGGRSGDVDTLLQVLRELGGATTGEDLLNRFAMRSASSLVDGERALEIARRRGLVCTEADVVRLA
ncbi:MAG: hypothetical protein U1F36_07375 [Planctomycetota bacterium]